MDKKWVIVGIITALFLAFLAWLFIGSSKPLPGTKITDLGRGHVPIGTPVEYNSNPPTSGKHYQEWIRAGVYDIPKDDRNLVHSLEHGYVVMHYKCASGQQVRGSDRSEASESAKSEGSPSAAESSGDCKTRHDQLSKIYEKKGKHKLIVVPRPNLDTKYALTAWNYLDKFDQFDEVRIEKFIDAYRDQGPERTLEP